ncbi:MAG: hypothetical protein V4529_16485 [Gemmatimonadota bacterium]
MKTAKEWLLETEPEQDPLYAGLDLELPHMHRAEFLRLVVRIQADARAEGRREGLEEALVACRQQLTADRCEYAISKLIEAEKGGGG